MAAAVARKAAVAVVAASMPMVAALTAKWENIVKGVAAEVRFALAASHLQGN